MLITRTFACESRGVFLLVQILKTKLYGNYQEE